MSSKTERAKQYFQQAKETYNPANSGFFNSAFDVSAELLFNDMCRIAGVSREYRYRFSFRQIFDSRLRELIEENKDFNENYLSKNIKTVIAKQKRQAYSVYFGVPIKRHPSDPLPFAKIFTIDGVTFKSISSDAFDRAHDKDCLSDYHTKLEKQLKPKQSLSWTTRDFYYFKASLEAEDVREAANLTANAFGMLEVCATVAQNSRHYTYSLFNPETKSRSILTSSGVMLISKNGHEKCDIMWSADIRLEAIQTLNFTSKVDRLKAYSSYRRICRETSPVSKRLKQFLFEYANALKTDDPHIRQLGLWRCLEIATNKQGSSRTEKDIVQIIANYYSNSSLWRQQGDAIKDIRNSFVHNGTVLEPDTWGSVDKYLNWTQEYVDTTLAILRWMHSNNVGKKSSDDIDNFFDLYSQSDATLKMAGKILRGRSKSRTKDLN